MIALHLLGAVLAVAGTGGLLMMAGAIRASPNAPLTKADRRWALCSAAMLAAGAALCTLI